MTRAGCDFASLFTQCCVMFVLSRPLHPKQFRSIPSRCSSIVIMSLAQAVDIHANDRGLTSCLTAASVHADVQKHFKDTVKVVTLED